MAPCNFTKGGLLLDSKTEFGVWIGPIWINKLKTMTLQNIYYFVKTSFMEPWMQKELRKKKIPKKRIVRF